MYKGIKISNSEKPNYIIETTTANYTIVSDTISSISPSREVEMKIANFPSEIDPNQFFEVGKTYLYHDTVIFSPLEPEEARSLPNFGLPYYEFYDRFNYNSTIYDDFISELTEIEMPNFYLSSRTEENDRYENLFAFSYNIASTSSFNNPYVLRNSYRERTQEDIQQLQNIFLSKDALRYGEAEKSRYPYAVDIKLNFKDIDIASTLLDNFKIHKSSVSIIDSLPKQNVSFNITNKNINDEEQSVSSIPVSSFEDLLSFAYFPRDGGLVYLPDNINRSRYTENLIKIDARTEYNKSAADHIPGMLSVLTGQTVKNEFLYIKLEKYSGDLATGNPIQNIWLRDASIVNQEDPAKSKFGIYDYYDTQVKIGQTYTYVIKAYVVIYGAEVTCMDADYSRATFQLKPSYKIVEVEIGSKTITVLPPIQLPPLVHPYYDVVKNNVSFYLQLVQGRKFMDYVLFRTQDEVYRQKIYDTSQYKKPEHAFMEDKSRFEVFRLEERPTSLENFSNFKIAEISRDGKSTSATFSQDIAFDKDYYYLFRSLNYLQYPSNPSKIHRIKLKKGIEKNFLEHEVFDILQEEPEYDIEKKFTKLIHIMPNIRDTFINESATSELNTFNNNINSVEVGLNENFSVWGKRYKIRIKSNNTGKKIDINVKFKLTREQ